MWKPTGKEPSLGPRQYMQVKKYGAAYAPDGCVITGTYFWIDGDDSIEGAYYQCFE
jgi:hypothetical protein